MLKLFRSQVGASLIQVVITAAVLSGLALVGTQIVTDLKKSGKGAESRDDLESLHASVVATLMDQENCTMTLNNCLTASPPKVCLAPGAVPVIEVGSHYMNQNVLVNGITTRSDASGDFLDIRYARLKKQDKKIGVGGADIKKSVRLKYITGESTLRCFADDEADRTEELTKEFCNELVQTSGLVMWDDVENRCKFQEHKCAAGTSFVGTSSAGLPICKPLNELINPSDLFNTSSSSCVNREALYLSVVGGKISIRCVECVPSAWTYGAWGVCSAGGTRTRTANCSNATCGCTGAAVTTQSCTPPCTPSAWSYGSWGTCSGSGTQTRTASCSNATCGCTGTAVTSQSCTPPPPPCTPSAWTYGSWGTCSGGSQTRTATCSNATCGCTGTAVTTQICSIPCTPSAWTYGAWGTCSGSGTQTRTASCSNATCGCTGAAVTSQSCTPPPPSCTPSSWTYGAWGTCSGSGTQTRTASCSNATCGCTGAAVTSQSCTPPCTPSSWTYGAWGTCSGSGTQTRTASCSNATCGCTGAAVTSQSCTPPCTPSAWTYSPWGACDASGNKHRTATCSNTTCGCVGAAYDREQCDPPCTPGAWTYGAWGACSGGNKTRTASCSNSTCGCIGAAVTTQSCAPVNCSSFENLWDESLGCTNNVIVTRPWYSVSADCKCQDYRGDFYVNCTYYSHQLYETQCAPK